MMIEMLRRINDHLTIHPEVKLMVFPGLTSGIEIIDSNATQTRSFPKTLSDDRAYQLEVLEGVQ
jgi:hypothetical protein